MTWRRCAWLIVTLLVGAAIGVGAMCDGDGVKPAMTDVGSTPATTPAGDTASPHLPGAFSFTDLSDWDEGSRIVGFDIPRSKMFPLAWPHFTVQPSVELQGKVARSVIAIYKVDGYDLRFTVAPASTWPTEALASGEPLEIDHRKGRLGRWEENSGDYAFQCGVSGEFGDIWCLVEFDTRSMDTLTKFVQDLTG